MSTRTLYLLTAFLCACAPASLAQAPRLASAGTAIEKRIADAHAEVGIVFRTLDGQSEWSYQPEVSFHAASTMKIPVMMELFHQVREGKLRLDDTLMVRNQFPSLVDGSLYRLDPADDSETTLYQAEGESRTLSELCDLMIRVSSNLATNLLIEKLGIENIRATVHALGADGMSVHRGVEDQKAFEKGWNNTTTARGLAILMTALATGQAIDREASRQMVQILEGQSFSEAIPAGLPRGTRVAHKTGEISGIHHDAAIVFAPRPFVLVLLVRGLTDPEKSSALMVAITRELYEATQ